MENNKEITMHTFQIISPNDITTLTAKSMKDAYRYAMAEIQCSGIVPGYLMIKRLKN
jgi:hypothetical protein